jgi:hypothetical protein
MTTQSSEHIFNEDRHASRNSARDDALFYFFIRRRNATSPIKPEPNSQNAAGMGTEDDVVVSIAATENSCA